MRDKDCYNSSDAPGKELKTRIAGQGKWDLYGMSGQGWLYKQSK